MAGEWYLWLSGNAGKPLFLIVAVCIIAIIFFSIWLVKREAKEWKKNDWHINHGHLMTNVADELEGPMQQIEAIVFTKADKVGRAGEEMEDSFKRDLADLEEMERKIDNYAYTCQKWKAHVKHLKDVVLGRLFVIEQAKKNNDEEEM